MLSLVARFCRGRESHFKFRFRTMELPEVSSAGWVERLQDCHPVPNADSLPVWLESLRERFRREKDSLSGPFLQWVSTCFNPPLARTISCVFCSMNLFTAADLRVVLRSFHSAMRHQQQFRLFANEEVRTPSQRS